MEGRDAVSAPEGTGRASGTVLGALVASCCIAVVADVIDHKGTQGSKEDQGMETYRTYICLYERYVDFHYS